jgi:hypothetical protein
MLTDVTPIYSYIDSFQYVAHYILGWSDCWYLGIDYTNTFPDECEIKRPFNERFDRTARIPLTDSQRPLFGNLVLRIWMEWNKRKKDR